MNAIKEYFPDGTEINSWFYDIKEPDLSDMGKQYVLTDYGVLDDGKIYTKEIQNLIDTAHQNGGGVIVVPKGTYMTGAIYFKQGVHLYVAKDGVLKGSDDINDYDVKLTRIEGELCNYFTALINVDNVDGFNMFGEGTIDGNGLKAWKAFWLRREWNPNCTNKDEQRPRLTFISNSKNVTVAGLTLKNSHFWTNHVYKSNHIKFLNCQILLNLNASNNFTDSRRTAHKSKDCNDFTNNGKIINNTHGMNQIKIIAKYYCRAKDASHSCCDIFSIGNTSPSNFYSVNYIPDDST